MIVLRLIDQAKRWPYLKLDEQRFEILRTLNPVDFQAFVLEGNFTHDRGTVINVGGVKVRVLNSFNPARNLTVTPRLDIPKFYPFEFGFDWDFLEEGECEPIELRNRHSTDSESVQLVAVSVIDGLILSKCHSLKICLWKDVNNIIDDPLMQKVFAPHCQRLMIELLVLQESHEFPTISCA
ncbi:hypothetical protein WICPIJ_007215 [Wickerhamomyces pijperi]|uniref:Uncharacterized protein n=1 Tax=Wickerhamomyces pijperi TaxID=599730 RepID=A0A9P8Q273_WICPI|nr:hypothetical protein WICPIJ_007215 [Wickerhamomyces pijperi]